VSNVKPEGSDLLDDAILRLLRDAPQRWDNLEADTLTATEQNALKLLTAAGLVERRFSVRLSLIGHPVWIEVTATATGEYGLVEALKPALRKAWDTWADFYREHRDGPAEEGPTFFCVQTAAEMWRLTEQGTLARQDVAAGNPKVVLDFVQKRTAVFFGKIVPGHGRAERIQEVRRVPTPSKVEIANLHELSGPLKDMVATMQNAFEKMAAGGGEVASEATGERADDGEDEETRFGPPQIDPYDDRVVNWLGRRLYLGRDTQVSRLFWLLAEHLGRPHDLGKVQRAVDGFETTRENDGEKEFKKAMQRVRKAVSKLNRRLRENGLDTHFMIIRDGPNDWPSYTMIRRFG